MWDSRGGPVAWIHIALSSTHRISTAHMSNNGNINIIVTKNNHVMGIPDHAYNNNPWDMNSDQCNRNIKTIITYTQVSLCNS